MAINASSLIWGPNNAFAFDQSTGKYYQGLNRNPNFAPDAFNSGNYIAGYDESLWGALKPDGTTNHGVGGTQYLFGDAGGKDSLGGLYDPKNPRYDSGWGANTPMFGASDFDLTGLSDEQKKLFGPDTLIAQFDHGPNAAKITQAPEEGVWSQLTGGNNSELPWYIPKGSPLAAILGVAGAAASVASAAGTAAGAQGAGTSAIGGVEGASALGGSASGAGGSALSWTDAIPNWAKGLTEGGSTSPGINGGNFNLSDWFKNLSSSSSTGVGSSGYDFSGLNGMSGYDTAGNLSNTPWSVNQNTGAANMGDDFDWGSIFGNETPDLGGGDLAGGLRDLSPQAAPTNMQDMITKLDSTAAGRSYLNTLMEQAGYPGGSSDGSVLQKLTQMLGGNSSSAIKMLGQLAATGLGMYGANKQAGALSGLSAQYANMGAPYRAMLAQSYADPNSFLANSPDIQASVNQGTSALARSLSTQGNPTGSGAALQSLQNYATQGLYGQLGNARNSLANYGGLSNFNQAAPGLAGQSIQAQGGALNALGSGISAITNPPTTLEQALNALNGLSGLKLNNGTGL